MVGVEVEVEVGRRVGWRRRWGGVPSGRRPRGVDFHGYTYYGYTCYLLVEDGGLGGAGLGDETLVEEREDVLADGVELSLHL